MAALADCVAGYFLDYENAAGKRLIVRAALHSERNDSMGFGVWEGDEYKTEEVPGMKAALFMRRQQGMNALHLYQTGLPPIEAMSVLDIGLQGVEPSRLDSATYDIRADELDEEAMLAFARGLA